MSPVSVSLVSLEYDNVVEVFDEVDARGCVPVASRKIINTAVMDFGKLGIRLNQPREVPRAEMAGAEFPVGAYGALRRSLAGGVDDVHAPNEPFTFVRRDTEESTAAGRRRQRERRRWQRARRKLGVGRVGPVGQRLKFRAGL